MSDPRDINVPDWPGLIEGAVASRMSPLAPGSDPSKDLAPAGNATGQQIKPWLKYQLCKDLATGEKTRAQLAREHGVNRSAITRFAQRHKARIEQIRAHIDDDFAGLWIADKQQRLASYEEDFELSRNSQRADHFEQIRTRTEIRKAVAEETGQLPARGLNVQGVVAHIIEGVAIEDLK